MTQTAHTPGPWNAGYYSSVVGLPVSAQPNPKENTIIICGVRGDRAVAEANARLIAAAPDLLDALMRAEWWISTQPDHSAISKVCRAAIAKATGVRP